MVEATIPITWLRLPITKGTKQNECRQVLVEKKTAPRFFFSCLRSFRAFWQLLQNHFSEARNSQAIRYLWHRVREVSSKRSVSGLQSGP